MLESSDVLSDGLENKLLLSDGEDEVHTVTEESLGELSIQSWHRPYHFSTDIKHVNMPTALTFIRVSQQIFFLKKIFTRRKPFLSCLITEPI